MQLTTANVVSLQLITCLDCACSTDATMQQGTMQPVSLLCVTMPPQNMQAVYHKGSQVVPEEFARQDPASVPAVIAAWVKALQGLEQAQHTQQALLDLLSTRLGHTQPKSAQVPLFPPDVVQTAVPLGFALLQGPAVSFTSLTSAH